MRNLSTARSLYNKTLLQFEAVNKVMQDINVMNRQIKQGEVDL